jgi:hypothetical protein
MPKDETLARIEREIAQGKLGIARDRLCGLIRSYPGDLSLRSRLGDVYFKLGFPREAGRYWYFDDSPSEDKEIAIKQFLNACGNDPEIVLRRLKLRSEDVDSEKVRELTAKGARRKIQALYDVGPVTFAPPNQRWAAIGCYAVLIVAVSFALIGFFTVVTWLKLVKGP